MADKKHKQTKASKVYECLREDIINGAILPGTKLQMEDLSERYGVGFSPLREALSRLSCNGLVTAKEQCGFCVSPLSVEELHDLYRVRIYVEELALELAMKHGDDQWEASVVSCWHRYAKFIHAHMNHKVDPARWDQFHREFTYIAISACQSQWLIKLNDLLYDHAARYRAICMSGNHINQKMLTEFIRENEQFVAALLARDKKHAINMRKKSWNESIKYISDALVKKYQFDEE